MSKHLISEPTISEKQFKQLCVSSQVQCEPVPTGAERTPDFRIRGGDNVEVFCEVKQIDPNHEDRADMADNAGGEVVGRRVPNRIRSKLKDSAQLKEASRGGYPTLLVLYDNTPGGLYAMHQNVIQAMFGQDSVKVTVSGNPGQPYLGGNRGLTKTQNTSLSAVAILDHTDSGLALRVYRNPDALVELRPEVLAPFPHQFGY